MNRALAAYNAAGLYARRGIVPRAWILDAWHHPLRDIKSSAEAFLAFRQEHHRHHAWRVAVDLEQLLDDALRYRSKTGCCLLDERARWTRWPLPLRRALRTLSRATPRLPQGRSRPRSGRFP